MAPIGEPIDQPPRDDPHRRLEPSRDVRGVECPVEGAAQARVRRRVGASEVTRREEQLVRVVVVVALSARERLPVARRPLDVVEPGERPDPSLTVVIERRLVAKTAIDGVRVVLADERVPAHRSVKA